MRFAFTVFAMLILTGCGKASYMEKASVTEKLSSFDVAEPAAAAVVTEPQIAYSYALYYRLADASVGAVQAQQVALCNDLGTARCRVVRTSISKGTGDSVIDAHTDLLIDARIASAFQQRLDATATKAGGEVAARSTTAEDVTKRVIDTDARVRAKQALADRLLKLIDSANGKVGDLVAAEQAFSNTQQDLDAARSLQATLRQHVTMSDISIAYVARSSSSLWSPVTRSLGDAGQSFGTSVGALVTFAVVALPWVLVLWVVIVVARRLGLRWPFRRRPTLPPPPDNPS